MNLQNFVEINFKICWTNNKMETEDRTYDTKTWKTGNSLVITIPKTTAKKLKIKSGDNIKVTISK